VGERNGEHVTAPITEPGVYDIPEDEYHADPVPGGSLSASGAKRILECPARFDHDRKIPPTPTTAMELGTAAHKLVLGVGQDLVRVDAENYRTKAAKDAAKAARAAGKVPLLPHEYSQAEAVAAAVLGHPVAGKLFQPGEGTPELSVFWVDEDYGIWRRARLDWLPHPWTRARLIIPDLKTCESASPAAIARAVANYRYHIQAAQYVDAVKAACTTTGEPVFLLVFVETTPPYLVTVAQLDDAAMDAGRAAMAEACERFRDCNETGLWPGYTPEDDIALISLPAWARTRESTYDY
jgi:PDDEXK-like domain of unknown function (DUF3799)